MYEALTSTLAARDQLEILDLGFGTGLCGLRLKRRARHLVGVDLSAAMIDQARERQIYDQLCTDEITDWLAANDQPFDVIAACDTLIYFGDLRQVIPLAAEHIRPGGVLVFTVERADTYPPLPDRLGSVCAPREPRSSGGGRGGTRGAPP